MIRSSWQLISRNITRLFVWIISPIQILMHLSFASPGKPPELKGNGTVLVFLLFSNLDIMLWVFILSPEEELFVIELIPFTQGLWIGFVCHEKLSPVGVPGVDPRGCKWLMHYDSHLVFTLIWARTTCCPYHNATWPLSALLLKYCFVL